MECGKIRKNLNAYLEGLSSPKEKRALEEHLATCRDCSAELEELRKTIHLMGNLDEVEPPAWLTQKVMTRVRAEAAVKESFLTRLFHRYSFRIPAAAVATLVVAVTAVILIKSMEPEIKETMPPAVPLSVEKQPLPPVGKIIPQPPQPEAKEESPTAGRPAGGSAHSDEVKSPAVSPRKQKAPEEIPREDRVAADRESNIIAGSTEPGTVSPAPAAPAAKKPATALPQPGVAGVAKDEAVFQTAPFRAERHRYAGKAMEEKSARSDTQLYPYKQVVTERHPGGRPYVVVTYRVTAGVQKKIMEERFDETGRRHGLHLAYDDSGKLKSEVMYEHGRISSAKEYNADGTLRPIESGQDWPWLRINAR